MSSERAAATAAGVAPTPEEGDALDDHRLRGRNAMQVIEGLYQLITPFPQFSYEQAREYRRDLGSKPRWIKSLPYVLPYLIRSNGETALVDNGWNTDSAFEALADGMAEHGAKPADLQQLII